MSENVRKLSSRPVAIGILLGDAILSQIIYTDTQPTRPPRFSKRSIDRKQSKIKALGLPSLTHFIEQFSIEIEFKKWKIDKISCILFYSIKSFISPNSFYLIGFYLSSDEANHFC